jgi:hypothetical protein
MSDEKRESRSYLKHCISPSLAGTIIVSGTGLSIDAVKLSAYSPQKPFIHWRVFTDTGHFRDLETLSAYIHRHVWPNRKLGGLDESQQTFLGHAWRWLRGQFVLSNTFCSQCLSRKKNLDIDLPHFLSVS